MDKWTSKTCRRSEKKGDIRELYNITKKLSQRKFRMNGTLKTKWGMFLTTQEEQMQSCEEHFSEIFNKDDNSVGSKQETRNIEEEE